MPAQRVSSKSSSARPMSKSAPWGFLTWHSNNKWIALIKDEYSIGSGKNSDIYIPSVECSLRHAKIVRQTKPGTLSPAIVALGNRVTSVEGHPLERGEVKTLHHDGRKVWIKMGADFTFHSANYKQKKPDYRDITEKYVLKDEIGDSAYATVQLATEKMSDIDYACKIIDKKAAGIINVDDEKAVLAAIERMSKMAHPNVLGVREFAVSDDHVYVYFELAKKGRDLFDWLVDGKGILTEGTVRHIMYQVFQAVKYLHDRGVQHRNLTIENLLLRDLHQEYPTIFLGDFGINKKPMAYQEAVNRRPSQHISKPKPDPSAYYPHYDCRLVGVIMFRLLCGRRLHEDCADSALKHLIHHGDFDFDYDGFKLRGHWADNVSWQAKNVVMGLLSRTEGGRLDMKDCLRHKWISNYSDSLESQYKDLIDRANRVRVGERTGPVIPLPARISKPAASSYSSRTASSTSGSATARASRSDPVSQQRPSPATSRPSSAAPYGSGGKAASSAGKPARTLRETLSQSPREAVKESPRLARSKLMHRDSRGGSRSSLARHDDDDRDLPRTRSVNREASPLYFLDGISGTEGGFEQFDVAQTAEDYRERLSDIRPRRHV
ncbi:hypothetical protein H9P43_008475 [Blastocladiella emersonii ATCC 22665]|nr:hypothetical protein H9P43_008475 [Blastocladiella emersonii ATCC 22665]